MRRGRENKPGYSAAAVRDSRRILHLCLPSIEQQALRDILIADLPDVVVTSVFNAVEAMEQMRLSPPPDLLLFLDIALDIEGRSLIAEVRRARPGIAIAAYGRFGLVDCQRWLAAGCDALIARDLPPARFIDAIEVALAGHRSVSCELVTELQDNEGGCAFLATCGWGHPLLDKMPAPLLLVQGDRFIYANRASAALLGHEMKELMQMRWTDIVADMHRDFMRARLEQWHRTGQVDPELVVGMTRKSGTPLWLHVQSVLCTIGGMPTAICTLGDVSRYLSALDPEHLRHLSPLELVAQKPASEMTGGQEKRAARASAISPDMALTGRQHQVLQQLATGASNKQIAHRLGISEATAKLHVHRILRSLKAASRAEAIQVGRRMGLLS